MSHVNHKLPQAYELLLDLGDSWTLTVDEPLAVLTIINRVEMSDPVIVTLNGDCVFSLVQGESLTLKADEAHVRSINISNSVSGAGSADVLVIVSYQGTAPVIS
jgi:hypothetical protein